MAHNQESVEQQAAGGIRALVDAVDREVSLLQAEHHDASAALAQSWARLVSWLALGPAPLTKVCMTCGKTVMREATNCGYCWTHFTAPD